MIESLKTLACKGLRRCGAPVVSSEERSEAHRMGVNYATKIYDPIFSELELKIKKLKEEISRDNSICLEKLEPINANYANSSKKDTYRLINLGWEFFSSKIIALYFPLGINKKDVGEYKKAFKAGYQEVEVIYMKKINNLIDEYIQLSVDKACVENKNEEMIKEIREIMIQRARELQDSAISDVLKQLGEV